MISDVQTKGSFYYSFDNGKKIASTTISSVGELMGIGMDFILFKKGSFYSTYDEKFKKIASDSVSNIGDIKNVCGSSINAIKGSFLRTFDKRFKKLSCIAYH